MAREIIQTVRTPLYDKDGRLRVYRVDTYSVERPETPQGQAQQQAPTPPPTAPVRPQPRQTPRPRVVTLTAKEFSQVLVAATMQGVPRPPDTMAEVIKLQRERGLRS
jgi:hypothetical protein